MNGLSQGHFFFDGLATFFLFGISFVHVSVVEIVAIFLLGNRMLLFLFLKVCISLKQFHGSIFDHSLSCISLWAICLLLCGQDP